MANGAPGLRRAHRHTPVVNILVVLETYTLKLVTGLGYLALTWSTVVLLGGFVGAVAKEDFWCLTVISMVQAAGIFTDWGERSALLGLIDLLTPICFRVMAGIIVPACSTVCLGVMEGIVSATGNIAGTIIRLLVFALLLVLGVVMGVIAAIGYLVYVAVMCVVLYPISLPVASLVLSLWRIVKRNYGNTNVADSNANMVAALDIFYYLVICQVALFFLWFLLQNVGGVYAYILENGGLKFNFESYKKFFGIKKKKGIRTYLFATRKKCWQKPTSLTGWNLINYAVGFLDSQEPGEYLDGARLLCDFVRLKGDEDVRSVLLRSRPKTQKLIDTLRITSNPDENREIRELAATIVADLSSDIDLAQYPGAIQCISSLLQEETTHQNIQEMTKKDAHNVQQQEEVDRSSGNELILQGLTILERLASNQDNCRDICSAPGLLPRIMAPIYSDTLMKDISSCGAWADVVNGSFKVLHQLIRAPGKASRRLRRQISSNKQAMSNLEGILVQGNRASKELQIQAAEIMTQLALDVVSINLTQKTKENLINKLLEDFLGGAIEQEPTTMLNPLTATAGRTLVLLSTNSKPYSDSIMTAYDNILARPTGLPKNTVAHLTELLDAKNNIRYRIIAAEILGNLCTHCDLDKEIVKETLLPTVTVLLQAPTEIPLRETREIKTSYEEKWCCRMLPVAFKKKKNEENQKNSAPGIDEENQQPFAVGNDEQNKGNCAPEDEEEVQEISSSGDHKKYPELQEALLSLIQVIYTKPIVDANDFDAVVENKTLGNGALMLKTLVDENCVATAVSLRIVKLSSQIAVSMMKRDKDTHEFKKQKFVESLSKAKKTMSKIESCMLFAGTDFGLKKTVRPLLSDIEKEARRLVRA